MNGGRLSGRTAPVTGAVRRIGLATQQMRSPSNSVRLIDQIRRGAEWFGDARLLFGSHRLVCTLAASYDNIVPTAEHALGELTAAARDKIFRENAARVYGLPETQR